MPNSRRLAVGSLTLTALLVLATGARAQLPGDLYGSGGTGGAMPGSIYTIDQTTGADTFVGDPTGGTVALPGMDFDSTGRMFAVTRDGTNTYASLLEINPDTGALINNVGIVENAANEDLAFTDLAFQPGTDVLYGFAVQRLVGIVDTLDTRLYTIDTTTAVATLVGDPGFGASGGLAFTPDGTLYATILGGLNRLVTLNPANAAVLTNVPTGSIDGLGARIDGQLFGTAAGFLGTNDIYLVAPDGSTTTIGASTNKISDLAFRPLLLDHYKCYQARETRGTPKFVPVIVALMDQFETVPASRIDRPRNLCNPVDKEHPPGVFSGILNPDSHLAGYRMRDDRSAIGKFQKRNILVINQFGAQEVRVLKPLQLLVPSSKAIAPDPAGPIPTVPDNYRCYKAKPRAGAVSPAGTTVDLTDQFGSSTDMLKKCFRFCNPVDKDGGGIQNPNGHLTCYRLAGPPPPAVAGPNIDVNIDNMLGPLALTARTFASRYLCTPSLKIELP